MFSTNPELEEAIRDLKVEHTDPKTLVEYAIYILQKDKANRTDKEIQVLRRYTTNFAFAKKVSTKYPKSLQELCKNLDLKIAGPGELLLGVGSIASTFYIILKGNVEVYCITTGKLKAEGKEELVIKKVSEIGAGQTIGENELAKEALVPSKETIKVTKDGECYLATLEARLYQKFLEDVRKEKEDQLKFLENNPLFSNDHEDKDDKDKEKEKAKNKDSKDKKQSNKYKMKDKGEDPNKWTEWQRMQVLESFHKDIYTKGYVIYDEGDACDDIFLIRSGEIQCTKTVKLSTEDTTFFFDENNSFYGMEQIPPRKVQDLGTIKAGVYFGEKEALHLLKEKSDISSKLNKYLAGFTFLNSLFKNTADEIKRETTMTVKSSTAEVWHIPAKDFFNIFDSRHRFLRAMMFLMYGRTMIKERITNCVTLNASVFGPSPNPKSNLKKMLNNSSMLLSLTKQNKRPTTPAKYDKIVYYNTVDEKQDTNSSTILNDSFKTTTASFRKYGSKVVRNTRSGSSTLGNEPKKEVTSVLLTKGFRKFKKEERTSPQPFKTPCSPNQLNNSSFSSKKVTPRNNDFLLKIQDLDESRVISPCMSRTTTNNTLFVDNILIEHLHESNRNLRRPQSGISRISNRQEDVVFDDFETMLGSTFCVQKIVDVSHNLLGFDKKDTLFPNKTQGWPSFREQTKKSSNLLKRVNRRNLSQQIPSNMSKSCLEEQHKKKPTPPATGPLRKMSIHSSRNALRYYKRDHKNDVSQQEKIEVQKVDSKSIKALIAKTIQLQTIMSEDLNNEFICLSKKQTIHPRQSLLLKLTNKFGAKNNNTQKLEASGIFRTSFSQPVSHMSSMMSIEANDVE